MSARNRLAAKATRRAEREARKRPRPERPAALRPERAPRPETANSETARATADAKRQRRCARNLRLADRAIRP